MFHRAGHDYRLVSGYLPDDKIAWGEIAEWVEAAKVRRVMRENSVDPRPLLLRHVGRL